MDLTKFLILGVLSASIELARARDTFWVWRYERGSHHLTSESLDYHSRNATSTIPDYMHKTMSQLDVKWIGSDFCWSEDQGCGDGFIKFEWLSEGELGFSLRNLWPNGLNRISPLDFQGLESLENLDLSYAKVSEISDYAFVSLNKLKILKLSFNHIHKFNEFTFVGPKNLYMMELKENMVTSLPVNSFLSCSKLQILNLDSNFISNVTTNSFNGLKNLERLFLNGNQIQVLRSQTFTRMLKLSVLMLRSNNISAIEAGAFDGLPDLKVLGISGNKLVFVTPDLFYHIRNNLAIVDLDRNEVEVWKDQAQYMEAGKIRAEEGRSRTTSGLPELRYVSAEEGGNIAQVMPRVSYYESVYKTLTLNNVYKNVFNDSETRLQEKMGSHFDFSSFFNHDHTSFTYDKDVLIDCSSGAESLTKSLGMLNDAEIRYALSFALRRCTNISDADFDEITNTPSRPRPSLFVSVSLPVLLVFVLPTILCLGQGMIRKYRLNKKTLTAKEEDKKGTTRGEEEIEMLSLSVRRRRAYSSDMNDDIDEFSFITMSTNQLDNLSVLDFDENEPDRMSLPTMPQAIPNSSTLLHANVTVHRSFSSNFESRTSASPMSSTTSSRTSVGPDSSTIWSETSQMEHCTISDENFVSSRYASSELTFKTAPSSPQSPYSYESATDELT